MARWANSCSPGVMERCFVVSGMTQMVAGKADCSHCSIVSPNNSGVRLFWTSQLTLHCVIYWTGGALFSWWMAIDSRHQLSIIAAATDLMETAPGHSPRLTCAVWGWGGCDSTRDARIVQLVCMPADKDEDEKIRRCKRHQQLSQCISIGVHLLCLQSFWSSFF